MRRLALVRLAIREKIYTDEITIPHNIERTVIQQLKVFEKKDNVASIDTCIFEKRDLSTESVFEV